MLFNVLQPTEARTIRQPLVVSLCTQSVLKCIKRAPAVGVMALS